MLFIINFDFKYQTLIEMKSTILVLGVLLIVLSGCREKGCTDSKACNYEPTAKKDDESCLYPGCKNTLAANYDENASCDDGSCFWMFNLFLDFWNPKGTNPQISFDGFNTSKEIKIDFDDKFEGMAVPPQFTEVIIDNIRIIDNSNNNYKIDSIKAYEWRDVGDWKLDVEFMMEYNPVEDLDLMIVLDASASLGEDFAKVKSYAKKFIENIYSNTPQAEIGIVSFSDEIHILELTNDKNELFSYIDNIQQGPFTSLYDAINDGVEILQENEAEGKAILVFTDGTDNNSQPKHTPSYLRDNLLNDPNKIKINSFTIGLEGKGGVDRSVLESIAVNGGTAGFPQNIEELGEVFEKVSKSISNVYNLTYIRNQQQILESDPAELKFEIYATRK